MPGSLKPMHDNDLKNVVGGRYTGPVFIYEIRDGDNLTILARRFGTTVKVLMELNGINSQNDIHTGLRLCVPQI